MRKKTLEVRIGNLKIGGSNAIAVQSMTDTDTADAAATAAQFMRLADAGSEMVRVTVNNPQAARAIPWIKEKLLKKGYTQPMIGDFHFNGHILLTRYPDCAGALDKYRINPGNSGTDENFRTFIGTAVKHKKPVRIGVNRGSINQKTLAKTGDIQRAMVESALQSAKTAENLGLPANRIVLSCKMSQVGDVIEVYRRLADRSNYALHLGLTEAGMGDKGLISSSAALAVLLREGIGDTIRMSLTPEPRAQKSADPRVKEVNACRLLLQSLGLRSFGPAVTSCPGCGRTDSVLHRKIAARVDAHLEKNPSAFTGLRIAVMGCVVNGPGEASGADIGLFLPGKNEKPLAHVYLKGKPYKILTGRDIAGQFLSILDAEFSGSS